MNERPSKADTDPPGSNVPAWLLATLLAVVTAVLYWPALGCGFIFFDDGAYVTSNPHVQTGLTAANFIWAFTTDQASNWHPLTWLSLMLDVSLFGNGAAGFHFTNVALHAANVVLLFCLLQQLTGATWRSALVAALFGWHPMHVESVAWIAERKDVLSTFFGFLSLIFYIHYVREREVRSQKSEVRILYGGALICFALGLMSKPMLVTWPFVLLLLDYWPLNRLGRVLTQPTKPRRLVAERDSVSRSALPAEPALETASLPCLPSIRCDSQSRAPGQCRDAPDRLSPLQPFRQWLPLLREKIPFFALSVAACVVTFVAQHHGDSVMPLEKIPPAMRIGNALVSYCRYLGKLIWPVDLAIFYPHPGYWPAGEVLAAVVFLTAVSAFSFWQRWRHPALLMGWLWYLGTLLPVIGLVQVGDQAMADRYAYIPSVGVLILIIWGAHELARRRVHQVILFMLAATAAICCGFTTRQQLGYWRTNESLLRHTLAITTNNFTILDALGATLASQGRTDEAIGYYREVLQLQPALVDTLNNLGMLLADEGHLAGAIDDYREAIRLNPHYPPARNNLGVALAKQGHLDDSLGEFQKTLRLDPGYADAHNNLGMAELMKGETDAAIRQFQEAIRLKPDYAAAQANLARALARKNGSMAPGVPPGQTVKPDQP